MQNDINQKSKNLYKRFFINTGFTGFWAWSCKNKSQSTVTKFIKDMSIQEKIGHNLEKIYLIKKF